MDLTFSLQSRSKIRQVEKEFPSCLRRITVEIIRRFSTYTTLTMLTKIERKCNKIDKKFSNNASIIFVVIVVFLIYKIMGIKYAHAYSYILEQLSADDVYRVAFSRFEHNNNKIDDVSKRRARPSIDIDVSLLIRTRGNSNLKSNSYYLIKFSNTLVQIGFDVMLVFDGESRHHSKRVTTQRIAECKKKKIEIVIRKSELMAIAQHRRTLDSIEERNNLSQQEDEIKKRIKSLENNIEHASLEVGDKLYILFQEEIKKLTPKNQNHIYYCQSVFQADSWSHGVLLTRADQ
jgi:hypothetical protein